MNDSDEAGIIQFEMSQIMIYQVRLSDNIIKGWLQIRVLLVQAML